MISSDLIGTHWSEEELFWKLTQIIWNCSTINLIIVEILINVPIISVITFIVVSIVMKIQSLIFVIFITFPQFQSQFKDFQFVKVKRLKCNTTNFKLVYENYTCFSKPINRNLTGLTLDIYFKRPINYFVVSQIWFKVKIWSKIKQH